VLLGQYRRTFPDRVGPQFLLWNSDCDGDSELMHWIWPATLRNPALDSLRIYVDLPGELFWGHPRFEYSLPKPIVGCALLFVASGPEGFDCGSIYTGHASRTSILK
jgi:hypothetical protein